MINIVNKKYYDLEIGQIRKNKAGDEYEIVEIGGCKSVKIRFLKRDFYKTTTAFYAYNGVVSLPKYLIGDSFVDKRGNVCRIVDKSSGNYVLAWEDGYTRTVQAGGVC